MVHLISRGRGRFSRATDHGLVYTFIPLIVLLSFFLAELTISPAICTPTDHSIDHRIPLLPGFIYPYLLGLPMVIFMGVLLLWKDWRCYERYMFFIGIACMSALIFHLLLPTRHDLRPAVLPGRGLTIRLLRLLYKADSSANTCPSLHAVGLCAVCFAAWDSRKLRTPRLLFPIWGLSLLILLSSIWVKQSSLLDLLAAVLHSTAAYLVVYRLIYRH